MLAALIFCADGYAQETVTLPVTPFCLEKSIVPSGSSGVASVTNSCPYQTSGFICSMTPQNGNCTLSTAFESIVFPHSQVAQLNAPNLSSVVVEECPINYQAGTPTSNSAPLECVSLYGTTPPTPTFTLASAILPNAQAGEEPSQTISAFVTIDNLSNAGAASCGIYLAPNAPTGLTLQFRATNSVTNQPIGSVDTPYNIQNEGSQSYVLYFTSNSPISQPQLPLVYGCWNAYPAQFISGVNTFGVLFTSGPTPNIVAESATPSGNGILHLTGNVGAFAVATSNTGIASSISVSVNTGSTSLPLSATICQTNASAQCLSAPASTVTVQFGASGTSTASPTFSVFVSASGTVPLQLAANRIYVDFADASGIVGATSVAVTTQ